MSELVASKIARLCEEVDALLVAGDRLVAVMGDDDQARARAVENWLALVARIKAHAEITP